MHDRVGCLFPFCLLHVATAAKNALQEMDGVCRSWEIRKGWVLIFPGVGFVGFLFGLVWMLGGLLHRDAMQWGFVLKRVSA